MEVILQPEKSSTCGQCCVAMISGLTEADIIALMKTKGPTRTKQIASVLAELGFNTRDQLKRITKKEVLPDLCMIKIIYPWHKNHSHWVVYNKGLIHCPGIGLYQYAEHFDQTAHLGKASSYLPVSPK